MEENNKYSEVVSVSKDYYDSQDADEFYHTVWGGEDIHIGLYESDTEDIKTASNRTVKTMADELELNENTRVLDVGAGYGGAARFLAKEYGCKVVCLNLSTAENNRNKEKNEEQGLSDKIDVVEGNFEALPFEDGSFDVVWSEDAILHSGEKGKVVKEVARVLKKGGSFIFTDPMQIDDCPAGVLQPVYDRIHLDSMGSFGKYRALAEDAGLVTKKITDLSKYLPMHYSRVADTLRSKRESLKGKISDEYIDRMLKGLSHWVEAGNNGYLSWGILHFVK